MASPSYSIAVVDDEESVRRALKRLLRSCGMDVRTFASGPEFLRSLEAHLPGCVVLDIHMEGMSGFEVQAELVARGLPLPVVFVTGFEVVGDEARALSAGARAYLRKPINEQDLLEAVQGAARPGGADRVPGKRP